MSCFGPSQPANRKTEIGPHNTVGGPQIPKAIETLAFMGKHVFPPSSIYCETGLKKHVWVNI